MRIVEQWVKDLSMDAMQLGKLSVGKVVDHPKHGRVKITDGAYWQPGGFSNFWYWRKIKNKRPYGKTFSGYGWM